MKALLIAVIIVMGLSLLGWMTFRTSDNEVSVTVHPDKAKNDTEEAVEAGKQLLDEASDAAEAVADRVEEQAPATSN